MMLIKQRCCYIQNLHFSYLLQEDSLQNTRQCCSSPLHPSGRCGISSGRSSIKHHPSRRWEFSIWTFLYVKKIRTVPGCIRPDVSATRPDVFQCSTIKMISFQNTDMERQLQLSRRCSVPIRTLSLIRKVVQKTFNSSNVRLHGSDAQALIWELRAIEVQPFGR